MSKLVKTEMERERERKKPVATRTSHRPWASLTTKKKKDASERYHQNGRENDAKRETENDIKLVSLAHAQRSEYFHLPSFDAASLPVASAGWSGITSKSTEDADFQEQWRSW